MAEPIVKEYISATSKSFVSNDIDGKMIKKNFIKIEGTFLLKVRYNTFYENEGKDVYKHLNSFLEVVEPLKIKGLSQDRFRLSIFPISLSGGAWHGALLRKILSPFETLNVYYAQERCFFSKTKARAEINPPEDDQLSEIEEHIEEECSEQEDVNEHIEKVLEIVDLFNIPKVTQDQIMLRAFPVSLTGAASRWLRNQPSWLDYNLGNLRFANEVGAIPSKTVAAAKTVIQEMAEYSKKWHNGTSLRTRSTETSDGLAAIQA
ncbi:hypothetical protein Tco_1285803 [Tanacetum coccineum]